MTLGGLVIGLLIGLALLRPRGWLEDAHARLLGGSVAVTAVALPAAVDLAASSRPDLPGVLALVAPGALLLGLLLRGPLGVPVTLFGACFCGWLWLGPLLA